MRVFGLPIEPPQAIVNRVVSDLGAIARAARTAPTQLDRMLALGEEIATIGREVVAVAERLDRRAEAIMELGTRLDSRGAAMVELGAQMRDMGERVDERGQEIVDRATRVADTGGELIAVLPTLERAIAMATPLEGAIDRFGRLVDRLPGGIRARQPQEPGSDRTPEGIRTRPDRPSDPPGPPPD